MNEQYDAKILGEKVSYFDDADLDINLEEIFKCQNKDT